MRKQSAAIVTAAFIVFCAPVAFGQPVQPSASYFVYDRNQSSAELDSELAQMQGAGMNTVIPISVGMLNGGAGTPGGPCTTLSANGLLYPSALVANPPTDDKLGTLLTLADARGMKVSLGSLQTAGDWTSGAEFDSLNSCNAAVFQEVHSLYGFHPSLVGVYSTQELWLNWVSYYGPSYYGITLLRNLVAAVEAADPNWVVFAAPVFKEAGSGAMPGLTPTGAQAALSVLLSGSGLKLVAPQDGQGVQAGAPSLSELPAYYSAMQTAALANNAQLWSTLETFANNGGSNQNQYPAAPVARIEQQVAAEAPYVSGIVTWIFGHDMSYQATYYPVASSQLYMDYQAYCCGVARLQKLPFVYAYGDALFPTTSWGQSYFPDWYATVAPADTHPDAQLTKLSDGVGGGYDSDGTDWVGLLDTQDNNMGVISLDLGQVRNVQRVRVLVLTQLERWIEFPQWTILTGHSGDNPTLMGISCLNVNPLPPDTSQYSVAWVDIQTISPSTRNIILQMPHVGWLFIAEIEVYGN